MKMETRHFEAPQRYAPGSLGALLGGLFALVFCLGFTGLMAVGVWVFLSSLSPVGWACIIGLLLGCVALGLLVEKNPDLVKRILKPIAYSWAIAWGLFILGLICIFLRSLLSMLTTYSGIAMLLFATLVGVLSRGWGGRDGNA